MLHTCARVNIFYKMASGLRCEGTKAKHIMMSRHQQGNKTHEQRCNSKS